MPEVKISRGPFASKEEAEAECEHIYKNYHPAGYGTYVRIEQASPTEQLPEGGWMVKGYRWDSCD